MGRDAGDCDADHYLLGQRGHRQHLGERRAVGFPVQSRCGAQGAFVDISMFGFSGGGLSGSPTLNGGASGNLTGTVHIANTGRLNEYLQDFTFGLSFQFKIVFDGPAVGSPDGTSTDTFGLALYDPSFNPQLSDGSLGDFILTVDVGTDGNTTVTTGSSPAGLVTVTPVLTPEPSTLVLFGIGWVGLVVLRRRAG